MALVKKENEVNNSSTKHRSFFVLVVFVLAFVVLICSLIDLQFIRREKIAAATSIKHTRTLKIEGTRGKILDINGIPLAQDEISYNLEFYREYNLKSEREQYTNSIIFAIELINKYGRDIDTTFAISKNAEGAYYFDWGNVSAETAEKRENTWRSDFYFADSKGKKMSPQEMYFEMRERYVIPEDMTDEMAFKVLGVWQDSIQSYWASKSITLLKNIGLELATAIESYSYELVGFNITEKSMRVYPQGTVGSHIVGYLGRITAENREYYDSLKYNIESLVGVSGIESVMEAELTGSSGERSGQRVVEVTSGGRILSEISYNAPKSGNNVYLTIDNNLQRVAEEALRRNIAEIKQRQLEEYNNPKNTQRYLRLVEERGGKPIRFASVGAVVVMDVTDGDVLALVSEPNYDPNLFSQGISQADLEAIVNNEAKPLFNKAISSSDTPGSIFKLGMSLAGLEEGAITATETIQDLGEYKKYVSGSEKGPMCGWYKDNHETHGHINVINAINYSCNYFYYELADRLGIEKIKKWASNLGLLDKTNIELTGESVGIVGDQKTLYDNTRDINDQDTSLPYLVSKQLVSIVEECASYSGKTLSPENIELITKRCFEMVGKSRTEIFELVQNMLVDEYALSRSKVRDDTRYKIYSSIVQITWTNTTTIQTGIGQSITTVTPIAVARYISALVNGGYVYDAHIVDKVTSSNGELVYEQNPTLVRKLDVDQENLSVIKKGMRDMVNESEDRYSSTARKYFDEFKYKEQLGGKTGTAQVSQINLEDNAWFVAFAPYEKPEIAIVVYIPNGRSGSMASSTVKEIAEYYLDLKYSVEDDSLPSDNTVVY
jgi:penicillin-binding protein 2